ncbi:MAG: PilN domain-containing protein [Gemmatimonadales bacterium]
MITINLKPGAKRQAAKGSPMAGFGTWMRGVASGVKEPALAVAAGTWIVALLVVGGIWLSTRSRLHRLEPQMQDAQNEYHRYHLFVIEKRQAERARDSILTQIGTIATVDKDRYVWPHLLDEIAGAMPDYTWLTSITSNTAPGTDSSAAPDVVITIVGQTTALENYTSFLRRLGDSHWLTNVLPVKTETVIDKNRPLTAFTIQATYTRADSSQIRTVPILESTVR